MDVKSLGYSTKPNSAVMVEFQRTGISQMILMSPRKVRTTNAPVLFLCVDVRHINIIHRLYDFTQSPTCPVTRNSRLKMASLMAIAHHNVPYKYYTIPYVLYHIKLISIIL